MRAWPSQYNLLLGLVAIVAGACATAGEPQSTALVSPPCRGGTLQAEELSIYRTYLESGAARTVYDTAQAPMLRLGKTAADRSMDDEVPWAAIEASLLERSGIADCLDAIASIPGFRMAAKPGKGTISLTRVGFGDHWAYFQYSLHYETSVETFGVLERKRDDTWTVVSVTPVGLELLNIRK